MVPAFIAGSLFSYFISDDSDVFFPGVGFLVAALCYLTGWCVHWYQHGARALTLRRRMGALSEFEAHA